MNRKLITIITTIAFITTTLPIPSYAQKSTLRSLASYRSKTAVSLEEGLGVEIGRTTAAKKTTGIFAKSKIPPGRRIARFNRMVDFSLRKAKTIPASHKRVYLKLAKIFIAIEVFVTIAKPLIYSGSFVCFLSGHFIAGAILFIGMSFLGGFWREVFVLYYKQRIQEVPLGLVIRTTWVPFWVGFTLSLPAQILHGSMRDLKSLVDISDKITVSLSYSKLGDQTKKELNGFLYEVANIILNWQRDDFEGGSKAKIRSAELTEEQVIRYLKDGRPILLFDSDENYEKIKLFLHTLWGGYNLENIYVFRVAEFLNAEDKTKNHFVERIFTADELAEIEASRRHKEHPRSEEEDELSMTDRYNQIAPVQFNLAPPQTIDSAA